MKIATYVKTGQHFGPALIVYENRRRSHAIYSPLVCKTRVAAIIEAERMKERK